MWESFVCDQVLITGVSSLKLSCWRLWPRSSSWACVFMFLRERVRKLVGVAAPSNLTRSSSIVIESDYTGILHCGEGENVVQVAPILIAIIFICDGLRLISLTCTLLYYQISILIIFILLSRLFVWTLYTPRNQLRTSTLI